MSPERPHEKPSLVADFVIREGYVCGLCDGTGTCPECGGEDGACSECNGTGKCPNCRGSGEEHSIHCALTDNQPWECVITAAEAEGIAQGRWPDWLTNDFISKGL